MGELWVRGGGIGTGGTGRYWEGVGQRLGALGWRPGPALGAAVGRCPSGGDSTGTGPVPWVSTGGTGRCPAAHATPRHGRWWPRWPVPIPSHSGVVAGRRGWIRPRSPEGTPREGAAPSRDTPTPGRAGSVRLRRIHPRQRSPPGRFNPPKSVPRTPWRSNPSPPQLPAAPQDLLTPGRAPASPGAAAPEGDSRLSALPRKASPALAKIPISCPFDAKSRRNLGLGMRTALRGHGAGGWGPWGPRGGALTPPQQRFHLPEQISHVLNPQS